MLHGSETWPIRKENEMALQLAEVRMVRRMYGIKLQDRVPSKGLRERLGLGDIISVLQQNRLRWYGSGSVNSSQECCYFTLSPFSTTGMGDRLRASIPPRYVIKPTRSTQSCIPLGLLKRVPTLIGWGKVGMSPLVGGR